MTAPANPRAEKPARTHALCEVLDELIEAVSDAKQEKVAVRALVSAVGRRTYGPLFLVIGLFAISPATIVPLMTSFTAMVILALAIQMALGLRRPWLPKSILDIEAPRQAMFDFFEKARPTIAKLDGVWLRPRLTFLTKPPFVNLVALCVAGAALITLPLSLIPFAPLAPGIAVVLFGLGMTAKDGLWLGLGVAAVAGSIWLASPLIF
ncbi:MAG TPA: exopolysaccharide biosynthesis protein [Terricaulis sp.]|nr:exopolysaccharide biosynthesis protein [Terricaulis sp.]